MTTLSVSSIMSMANTAALRSLGSELNGYLSTVGLVQQADTGQINWTTVNLPAASTAIGYEIWAFADLSIVMRIDWATGSSATNAPSMSLTVGTGSDGSGNITGPSFPKTALIANSAIASTTTNYITYACVNSDLFWIVWKAGARASGQPGMFFCIEKTCDSSGTPTTDGYVVTSNTSIVSIPSKQAIRTASPSTVFSSTTSFCVVPGNLTNSSTIAGSKQVFLHQHPIPDILLSNCIATIVAAEAPIGTTLTATPVGSTPQTMISMGTQCGYGNSASASALWSIVLRWQ